MQFRGEESVELHINSTYTPIWHGAYIWGPLHVISSILLEFKIKIFVTFVTKMQQIRCADHMSTQYRLVQSGKTASAGCSAGPGSSEL
jgi:hypothetical protein